MYCCELDFPNFCLNFLAARLFVSKFAFLLWVFLCRGLFLCRVTARSKTVLNDPQLSNVSTNGGLQSFVYFHLTLRKPVTQACYASLLRKPVMQACYASLLRKPVTQACYASLLRKPVTQACYASLWLNSITIDKFCA